MPITAVILDLDETLLHEEKSVYATFLATCLRAQERYNLDPEAFAQTIQAEARALWNTCAARSYCLDIGISSWEGLSGAFTGADPNLRFLHAWAPTYRRDAWTRALATHGINDGEFAAELADAFIVERQKWHIVFPEAERVLQHLLKTYRIGLLTNGAPDVQLEKLQTPNLSRYFEVIGVSGIIGAGKPDPRAFNYILDKLGVAPDSAAMIGDNLRNDVAGAQKVGMMGIWLNRYGAEGDHSVKPDAEIRNLTELSGILERPLL